MHFRQVASLAVGSAQTLPWAFSGLFSPVHDNGPAERVRRSYRPFAVAARFHAIVRCPPRGFGRQRGDHRVMNGNWSSERTSARAARTLQRSAARAQLATRQRA
jgi:hypothetical protein